MKTLFAIVVCFVTTSIAQGQQPLSPNDFVPLQERVEKLEQRVDRLEKAAFKSITQNPIVQTPIVQIETPIETTTFSTTTTCTGPGCAQQMQTSGWYLGKNIVKRR